MNIEDIRQYCLSKPYATEDFPFDDEILAFRVMNKIFACINLNHPDWFCLKCDPDYALELRERYPSITGAWHWNKKYWNQLASGSDLSDAMVRHLIDHSYHEVIRKLPKRLRSQLV